MQPTAFKLCLRIGNNNNASSSYDDVTNKNNIPTSHRLTAPSPFPCDNAHIVNKLADLPKTTLLRQMKINAKEIAGLCNTHRPTDRPTRNGLKIVDLLVQWQ